MADERPPMESFFQKEDLDPIESEVEIRFLRGKRGEKGDSGSPGKDAELPSEAKLISLLKPFIPKPIAGKPGKDGKSVEASDLIPLIQDLMPEAVKPSMEDIEAIVLPLLPETVVIPELSPKETIEVINRAKTAKIKKERVEGLDELEGLAKSANRNVQNFISLGGNRQTKLQLNGAAPLTGVDTINFIGGTLTPVGDGTTANYTPPASGGGGSYQQPTSGVVNGVNTVFTWATAPNVIVVDQGRTMQKTNNGDGNANWTGTTTTTLQIAPNQDIFATN